MAALDESIVASVANANFKAAAEVPTLLSNVLSQDILVHARNATANAVQTASDSRNIGASAMGVLTKRICEYDTSEAAASFSASAHTNRMAVTSAAGADSAQLGQSMLQMGNAQQAIQVQLAQLIALLAGQKA